MVAAAAITEVEGHIILVQRLSEDNSRWEFLKDEMQSGSQLLDHDVKLVLAKTVVFLGLAWNKISLDYLEFISGGPWKFLRYP